MNLILTMLGLLVIAISLLSYLASGRILWWCWQDTRHIVKATPQIVRRYDQGIVLPLLLWPVGLVVTAGSVLTGSLWAGAVATAVVAFVMRLARRNAHHAMLQIIAVEPTGPPRNTPAN